MVRTVIALPFTRKAASPVQPPLTEADLAAAEAVCAAFADEETDGAEPVADLDRPDVAQTRQVWDALGVLDARDFALDATPAAPVTTRRRVWAAGAAALAACLVAAVWLQSRAGFETYSTAIGEQKAVTLADGSRLRLNTGTSLEARITASRREVRLISGEAWFAVAKQGEGAPFTVSAGPAQIRVTGTQFNVRHLTGQTRIDLLEGHIRVSSRKDAKANRLKSGEAIRVDDRGHMSPLEAAETARINDWRAGRISFYQTRLDEAVTEFNRYALKPIALADPALGALRVDGVFDTGDTTRFARAAAAVHGLNLKETGSGLEIQGAPEPPIGSSRQAPD